MSPSASTQLSADSLSALWRGESPSLRSLALPLQPHGPDSARSHLWLGWDLLTGLSPDALSTPTPPPPGSWSCFYEWNLTLTLPDSTPFHRPPSLEGKEHPLDRVSSASGSRNMDARLSAQVRLCPGRSPPAGKTRPLPDRHSSEYPLQPVRKQTCPRPHFASTRAFLMTQFLTIEAVETKTQRTKSLY